MPSLLRYSILPLCIVLSFACKGEKGSFTGDGPFDYSTRMFVADEDSSGRFVCFTANDTTLLPGTRATIVFTGVSQRTVVGRITSRGKLPCIPGPPMPPMDSMQYVAEMPLDTSDRALPVVVLGPIPEPVQLGDTVTIAIEPGQPSIRFRVCASSEGLHATAWAGPPLASKRRWHAYYYLGYDVDPTCSDSEAAPDSSAASAGGDE